MSNYCTYFSTPNGEEMVIQTKKNFDRMAQLAEIGEAKAEADDIAAILERVRTGEEELFPHEVVKQLVDGENPIRVYRKHRELTMKELADKAGLSQSLISDIENGKKEGGMRAMKSIASVLKTTIDDLIWDHDG